eukprot:scpid105570/ scgid8284/ Craniofacial development protein 2; p97 bucentaur protein
MLFITGDFDCKLGVRRNDEPIMGKYGRGHRNLSGTVLADFMEAHQLFAGNTAFQHSARHRTTWQGQRRDTVTGSIVPIYNTIDYICCRQDQKQLLTDARSFAGTLLNSA